MPRLKLLLSAIGALAGVSLYLVMRLALDGLLVGRSALAVMVFAGVFFSALLVLTGPFQLWRASVRAAILAAVVAALVSWAGLRYDTVSQVMGSPIVLVSGLLLSLLPLPFLMADDIEHWRDYPALFTTAWAVVMRVSMAWLFVGFIWAVIYLSHVLLSLVGIDAIAQLVLTPAVPWLISGTGFGLAMAVAQDLSEVVSPELVLRLFRILLPVVLVVILVFLGAVALEGPSRLLGGFSIGAALLVMTAVAATLIAAAVDQTDFDAAYNPFLVSATRALALILILPPALAGWMIWERVAALGWTPGRLFAATVAALGIGYGAFYAVAVLRGSGWMERIRQANIWMALTIVAVAALWLTPVLNPERISAESQLARYKSGEMPVARLDLKALQRWGRAGAATLAALHGLAATDPALAAALAGPSARPRVDVATLRADLAKDLPVQPAEAADFRARLLARAGVDDLQNWQRACGTRLPGGEPGCVLVVGDFLPDMPGQEGLLILSMPSGYLSYLGLSLADGTGVARLQVDSGNGELASFGPGQRLIVDLQHAMPPMRPVTRNELAVPLGGALSLRP